MSKVKEISSIDIGSHRPLNDILRAQAIPVADKIYQES